MLQQRVLTPEQISELASQLAGLRLSWAPAELGRVTDELGWSVAAPPRRVGGSAVVQTGLPVARGLADLALFGEDKGEISVRVSDPEEKGTPAATALNRDAFATAVRAVTAVVGEPVNRRPGEDPEVRWPAASGVLRVAQGVHFVELALVSEKYLRMLDEALAAPVDDEFVGDDW
jgi:hypothetical protein